MSKKQDREFSFRFYDKSKLDEVAFAEVLKPQTEAAIKEEEEEYIRKKNSRTNRVFSPDLIYNSSSMVSTGENPFPNIDFIYSATYYESTSQFEITTFVCTANIMVPIVGEKCKNPYEIFYTHCTFREILNSIGFFSDLPCWNEEEAIRHEKALHEEDERTVLELIAERPWLLREMKYLYIFEKVLITARWSQDRKEAKAARNLLEKHFIPKRPGGKVPIPRGLNIPMKLIQDLAEHLSLKGKNVFDEFGNYERGQKKMSKNDYKILKNWAKEKKEFRISPLSLDDLSTLIFTPSTFVDDIMETYFKVSIKTISRR